VKGYSLGRRGEGGRGGEGKCIAMAWGWQREREGGTHQLISMNQS